MTRPKFETLEVASLALISGETGFGSGISFKLLVRPHGKSRLHLPVCETKRKHGREGDNRAESLKFVS